MNDLEISRALALAIGWREDQLKVYETHLVIYVRGHFARRFSHKDWSVIGPIAERYYCFPDQFVDNHGKVVAWEAGCYDELRGRCMHIGKADTPQKAIALAVIRGAKE